MAFADRGFEFFLDLGLRLAQHVFDDGLAGFRIVADCVPALPAAILALANTSLAVCSSFWHGISLLCNGKAYRKQQRKATEKPNCYQKVIICAGCPIFVYGDAISALLGAFSLVSAVRFSDGQGILSIDYSGSKYARFTPKIAAVLKSLF